MTRATRVLAALAALALLFFGCAEDKSEQASDESVSFTAQSIDYLKAQAGNKINDILCVAPHLCAEDTESCRRELDFALSLMSEAGVKTIRIDFPWSQIESQNDSYDFSHQEFLLDWAQNYEINIEALLAYCTDWACEPDNTSSIDVEQYAEYAGMVASTLGDRLTYYEVWNEPDLSGIFWKPRSDPAKYGELLKAAYTAIKQNDPDAKVLFGGLAGSCPLSMFPDPYCVWGFYLQVKYFHPDIDNYFDIFNIHGYSMWFYFAPEWELPIFEITCPSLEDKITRAQKLTGKPVWNTEFGWQCEPHYPSLTKQLQAAYLARGYIISAASKAERACWYTFWHEGTGMGLIDEDWQTIKPAYYALKTLHELLGKLRPVNVSEKLGLRFWERGYLFFDEKDAPKALALWSVAPDAKRDALIKLPSTNEHLKVYDMFGNLLMTIEAPTHEFKLEISNYPIYVIW